MYKFYVDILYIYPNFKSGWLELLDSIQCTCTCYRQVNKNMNIL